METIDTKIINGKVPFALINFIDIENSPVIGLNRGTYNQVLSGNPADASYPEGMFGGSTDDLTVDDDIEQQIRLPNERVENLLVLNAARSSGIDRNYLDWLYLQFRLSTFLMSVTLSLSILFRNSLSKNNSSSPWSP
jgi:hypothetical protein